MALLFFLAAEIFTIPGYFITSLIWKSKRQPIVFSKFIGIIAVITLAFVASVVLRQSTFIIFLITYFTITIFSGALALYFGVRLKPTRNEVINYVAMMVAGLGVFFLLNFFRTFRPDVNGTEKFMDVALINTIIKQDRVPIENPWLAGFQMNYYYLGHYLLAMIHQVSRVTADIGYNFGISLVAVWILQSLWVLVQGITKKPIWSYFAAVVTTFGGNLYLLYDWIFNKNSGPWFASATRVIPFTINEFPSYSIILGDLHGHYLSLAFFVIGIHIILMLFRDLIAAAKKTSKKITAKTSFDIRIFIKTQKNNILYGIVVGVLLGFLFYINSWDVFSLAFLMVGIGIAVMLLYYKQKDALISKIKSLVVFGVFVAIPAVALFLISRLVFLPAVSGIGINTSFSPFLGYVQLFGQFMILVVWILICVFALRKKIRQNEHLKTALIQSMILFLVGVFIIAFVEFIYFKDVFSTLNPPYSRTNTVFKFYFHAWVFISTGVFVAVIELLSFFDTIYKALWKQVVVRIPIALVVFIMMSFLFIGIMQFLPVTYESGLASRFIDDKKIDGYSYVTSLYGEDREMMKFLADKPYSVIAEYVDYESYSYGARFSAYTGDTAIEGWPLHNVQWYGGYDGKGYFIPEKQLKVVDVATRVTDIGTLYSSTEKSVVSDIILKYNVKYVMIGSKELEILNKNNKTDIYQPFDSICDIVWQKNDSRIYECK